MPKKQEKKTTKSTKKGLPQEKEARLQSLRSLAGSINSAMKQDVIRLAGDEDSLYILRRPTGIMSLDIAMAGGFPASAPSVVTGPDGAGKDYLIWKTCAEVQRLYGENFRMVAYFTEFLPDKNFMRHMCGLKVGFTKSELDEMDQARMAVGIPAFTAEERADYSTEVGEIGIIAGVTAEEGFDAILKIVQSNTCQIVIVNSIGFLQTQAKEDLDSFKEFAQQRDRKSVV